MKQKSRILEHIDENANNISGLKYLFRLTSLLTILALVILLYIHKGGYLPIVGIWVMSIQMSCMELIKKRIKEMKLRNVREPIGEGLAANILDTGNILFTGMLLAIVLGGSVIWFLTGCQVPTDHGELLEIVVISLSLIGLNLLVSNRIKYYYKNIKAGIGAV